MNSHVHSLVTEAFSISSQGNQDDYYQCITHTHVYTHYEIALHAHYYAIRTTHSR